MSGVISLPPRCDTTFADTLETTLAGGGSASLDASGVQIFGALCLEVLMGAVTARQETDSTITISDPSDGFIAALNVFGLTPERLTAGDF